MIKIGYLGPEGTFSEKAAQKWQMFLQMPHRLEGKESIPQLFRDLENKVLNQIVVPVENSIEGSVTVTQDYLISLQEVNVLGEISLSIEHYLVTNGTNSLQKIIGVYSHPQALAQCHRFLEQHLKHARLFQTTSTAEAARIVSETKEPIAAITSLDAAIKYNLTVLAQKIQDFNGNKTRFWALGDANIRPQETIEGSFVAKTSIVVALPYNRPGGLYEILKEFAEVSLDLTRIESRPTKKELGEYLFIIDFIGHLQEEAVIKTFAKLRAKGVMIKILGSFPVIN